MHTPQHTRCQLWMRRKPGLRTRKPAVHASSRKKKLRTDSLETLGYTDTRWDVQYEWLLINSRGYMKNRFPLAHTRDSRSGVLVHLAKKAPTLPFSRCRALSREPEFLQGQKVFLFPLRLLPAHRAAGVSTRGTKPDKGVRKRTYLGYHRIERRLS